MSMLFNRGSSSSITSPGSLMMNLAKAINPNASDDVRMFSVMPSGRGSARNIFRAALTVIKPKMGSRRCASRSRISVVPSKTSDSVSREKLNGHGGRRTCKRFAYRSRKSRL